MAAGLLQIASPALPPARRRQRGWQNRVLLLHKVAAGTLKRSVNRAPSVSPMGDVTGVVMGDGQTRWLTYRELAITLRINAASARRLVARNKQWPRRPGNDGLVRIGVPIEKLPRDGTHDVVDDPTRDITHAPTHDDTWHDDTGVVRALEAHVGTLKEALSKAEARIEGLERNLVEERARAALLQAEAATVPVLNTTVEALKSALEGERSHLTEVRAERDRLATRRSWWLWRRSG